MAIFSKLMHIVAMSCVVTTAFASSNAKQAPLTNALNPKAEITRDDLINAAKANGTLFVSAAFCEKSKHKTPEKLLLTLLEKHELRSLALAKEHHIIFDANTYRESVEAGIQAMFELLSNVPRSGASYESNCQEINDKVKKNLADLNN